MAATGSEPLPPDTKCSLPRGEFGSKKPRNLEGEEKKKPLGSKLHGERRDQYSDGILFISRSGGGQHGVPVGAGLLGNRLVGPPSSTIATVPLQL